MNSHIDMEHQRRPFPKTLQAGMNEGSDFEDIDYARQQAGSHARKSRKKVRQNLEFERAPSFSPISDEDTKDEESSGFRTPQRSIRTRGFDQSPISPSHLSTLNSLPNEIIQDIAVRLGSDLDFSSMVRTSPILCSVLSPERRNDVWRQRFLTVYDSPCLDSPCEYPFAYKIRSFVLQKFDVIAIAHGLKQKSGHQLDVIKDLIIETYNKPDPHKSPPRVSKNLAILSAPYPPLWLANLMGCPFYGSEKQKYGRPNLLFDMIQVCLSHLVLSPKSPVLSQIPSSRGNYDLAQVYNYNKPFSTFLEVLEEELEEVVPPFRSARFPNLRSPAKSPEPVECQYRLNVHSLLHVRNFWQRHLNEDPQGVDENTYTSMMRNLSALNIVPQAWTNPLSDFVPFNQKWCGHYSSLNPWPKSRRDLEERQSCAEDWETVDPMTINVETSTTNDENIFWPPTFSSIPAFAEMLPDLAFAEQRNVTYIRGIAPFVDPKLLASKISDLATGNQKWHPYLASRVSGFVHDIPNETLIDEDAQERRNNAYDDESEDRPIPGWKHIVMIMWKPTTRYLLAVLDHAEEQYGGASGAQISADFNTANIWSNAAGGQVNPAANLDATHTGPNVATGSDNGNPVATNTANVNTNTNAVTTPLLNQPTEAQIEAQMKVLLSQRIQSFTKTYTDLLNTQAQAGTQPTGPTLPPLFSPVHIRTLEDAFSPHTYLSWDDGTIDYAYAYEGVIIPGGKIMLGRWWRIHGLEGLGPGREIGLDGVGVEVRPVLEDQEGAGMDADGDSEGESGNMSGRAKGKGKTKGKAKRSTKTAVKQVSAGGNKKVRRSSRGKKRKAREIDSDEDGESELETDVCVSGEKNREVEYEFVTLVNGEESRAVNGCKGLERGPFVFWAT